ncbi:MULTISPECIES: SDR family NAD(P)-dependent oxidoreductase [Sphingomonas]|uniref:SDR family NAD(P)-dependent oxidoreductase n=1 Tax=Sphingomonas TaxID=13687 RepID=UPI00180AC9AF|nr:MULTISPECIES: SDR family oxidoreductase [Sphingomonas]MBB4049500.1 glucose 1-dehydrogenase [Sphingomonas zeae]MDK8188050.1 SDR family oxidoreductase [Sphingomonas zeae]MDK8217990.1 SDR family oxidoreductase [Sphingomonas sp. UMB7805-LC452B]
MASQTVIVTGAESGIGAACAEAFGATGARVAVLFHSDQVAADVTAGAVRQAGGEAMTVQVAVDDEGSVDQAFGTVEAQWGPADVLVNSAGLNMSGVTVRDMTLAQWQRMLDTDLTGAFLTSRRFLTGRGEAKGDATILQISSIHAYAMRAGGADYCAAKGGLTNLVDTLAIEEAPRGIRVNAIEPGMILTPMNAKAQTDPAYRASLEKNIPIGRAGNASEVADLAVFLASDKARYITGARIVIDGGLSLMQALGA